MPEEKTVLLPASVLITFCIVIFLAFAAGVGAVWIALPHTCAETCLPEDGGTP
jgi:hypothetical protein